MREFLTSFFPLEIHFVVEAITSGLKSSSSTGAVFGAFWGRGRSIRVGMVRANWRHPHMPAFLKHHPIDILDSQNRMYEFIVRVFL
jgi:hypothetical protein